MGINIYLRIGKLHLKSLIEIKKNICSNLQEKNFFREFDHANIGIQMNDHLMQSESELNINIGRVRG
jgi:hypothetical protein